MSILPTTKMSCMLKNFRSRVSAEVEQLCLLAKLVPNDVKVIYSNSGVRRIRCIL